VLLDGGSHRVLEKLQQNVLQMSGHIGEMQVRTYSTYPAFSLVASLYRMQ
jgi:hypothetical protein